MRHSCCGGVFAFTSSAFAFLFSTLLVGRLAPAASVQYLGENRQAGLSAAVVVDGYRVAQTAQLLPLDKQGRLVGEGSVEAQLAQAFFNLETALAAAGTGTEHLVKLTLYVDGPKTAAAAREMLEKRCRAPVRPALSWVVTALPHPKAMLALDAVAAVPGEGPAAVARRRCGALAGYGEAACAAVFLPSEAVYVSGQAEEGDLPTATAKTLESLLRTIGHVGLDRNHVVHLKASVRPMTQAAVVKDEVARAFAGQAAPPLTLVEWKSAAERPIEIEMTAFAPRGKHGGKVIYVSGLCSEKPGSGEAQARGLFGSLENVLKTAGSDPRHLVKGTCYCSDEESSKAIDRILPEFHDPQCPPATSKALVQGVALPGRSITMDGIAIVPKGGK